MNTSRTKERNAKAKELREAAGNYKKGEVVFYNPVKLHQSWEKYKLPNGKYLAMISKGISGRARFGGNYQVQILQDISNQPDELKKYDEYKAAGTKYNLGYYATFEGKIYKRILQNLSAWPNVLSRTTNTEPDNIALELEAEALALELELLKLK